MRVTAVGRPRVAPAPAVAAAVAPAPAPAVAPAPAPAVAPAAAVAAAPARAPAPAVAVGDAPCAREAVPSVNGHPAQAGEDAGTHVPHAEPPLTTSPMRVASSATASARSTEMPRLRAALRGLEPAASCVMTASKTPLTTASPPGRRAPRARKRPRTGLLRRRPSSAGRTSGAVRQGLQGTAGTPRRRP